MWMRRRTTNRNVPLGGRTIFQKVAQRRTCQACLLVLVVFLFLYCCTTLFSTQSDTEDHKGYHSINRTVIRESKQSLNVKLVQGKKTESLLEKMEYQLIKAFMGRVIASHNRRLKSSAKLNNLIDGVKASNETLKTTDITRRTKGDIQRRGDKKGAKREKMRSGDKVNTSENETQRLTSNGRPSSLTHHPRPVTHHPRPVTHHNTSSSPMKILVYTNFFGQKKSWSDILGSRTELHGCPTANCIFTSDTSEVSEADALIFHAFDFHPNKVPRVRQPHQRYIWLTHESPGLFNKAGLADNMRSTGAGFFNWTITYHRRSDVLLLYGGLRSIRGEGDPARPGLLDKSGVTYRAYMKALEGGVVPGGKLEFEAEGNWSSFLTRPKLASWMVSHCHTLSGRELYVRELQKYVQVDVYGTCGNLTCGKTHLDTHCYEQVLRPNYKFYLAFENNMCVDYITEKVWYPLHHGLVPVVFGGALYSDFLPPHSYLDASHLTPRQLANLLTSVAESPEQYARYHLWRRYWQVMNYPPLCELCHKLHHDHQPSTLAYSPAAWWSTVNNCTTLYPLDQYPRKDLRVLLYDLKEKMGVLGDMFRRS